MLISFLMVRVPAPFADQALYLNKHMPLPASMGYRDYKMRGGKGKIRDSQRRRIERITRGHFPAYISGVKPFHALRRRAMREGIRHDIAL
jgi:hypothetical protein